MVSSGVYFANKTCFKTMKIEFPREIGFNSGGSLFNKKRKAWQPAQKSNSPILESTRKSRTGESENKIDWGQAYTLSPPKKDSSI